MHRPTRALAALLAVFSLAALAPGQTLRAVQLANNLGLPTDAASPPGDERIFVTTSEGLVWVLEHGVRRSQPFLDLTTVVLPEQGLMSIAFHPDYSVNGRFFVSYLDPNTEAVLAEYAVSAAPNVADPASGQILLGPYPQIGTAHNWNCLRFGPDGLLYLATGDGGASHTENQAQDLGSLNGKILRLDVDLPAPWIPADNPFIGVPGAREEIWMYGLRQPWRIAFDGATGDLYVADVGNADEEEVNFVAAADQGGQNFGWRCHEGLSCTSFPACVCNLPQYTAPVHAVTHAEMCAVIGGAVYRGSIMPELDGAFVFADHCTGRVWSMRSPQGGSPLLVEHTDELSPTGGTQLRVITSISSDANGELLLLDRLDGGRLFRIAPSPVDRYCRANPNSAGTTAEVFVSGSASVSTNDLQLSVRDAVPSAFGLFFYGDRRVLLPFGEGLRCAGGVTQRVRPPLAVNGAGIGMRSYDLTVQPNPDTAIEPGATWSFQFWYRDSQSAAGFNTSDAVTATFLP